MSTEYKDFDNNIERAAANLMPVWTFWGDGVVLVSKNNWLKSQRRIESLLRQVHRSKKQIVELREAKNG